MAEQKRLKVYTATGFTGRCPTNTAAVVVAESKRQAARLLNRELRAQGLEGVDDDTEITLLDLRAPRAVVLCDGDY